MYFNEHRKIGYLAQPKTASQATATALMRQAGFVKINHQGNKVSDRRTRHHAGPDFDLTEEWLTFTATRNHFDALVSFWFHVGNNKNFKNFLQQDPIHQRYFPEWDRLWTLHMDNASVVIRYENLEEDVNQVLDRVGLGPVDIPHQNTTTARDHRDYRKYYDEEARQIVEDRFGEEMEELGYSW